jgi:hypothetical protein
MSHLAHIVKYKERLINNGICDPNTQIKIVQTCYVKALISIAAINKLSSTNMTKFNNYILSYWNETTPVDGFLVNSLVARFYHELETSLIKMDQGERLIVSVIPAIDVPEGIDYYTIDGYTAIIDTLKIEATCKLNEFLETCGD